MASTKPNSPSPDADELLLQELPNDNQNQSDVEKSKSKALNADDLFETTVGANGLWQWCIVLLMATCNPITSTLPVFLNAEPFRRCRMPGQMEDVLSKVNMSFPDLTKLLGPHGGDYGKYGGCYRYKLDASITQIQDPIALVSALEVTPIKNYESCVDGYVVESEFFQYPGSAVKEYEVWCDSKWLAPLTTSLFMTGTLFGYMVGGWCGDRFGRRPSLIAFCILDLLFFGACSASPNFPFLMAMRLLVGFSNTAKASIIRVMVVEVTIAKYRAYFTSTILIGQSFVQRSFFALWAYLFQYWRWLNLAIAFPGTVGLLFFCLLPESPRWLLSRNRKADALKVFKRACIMNHRCKESPESRDLDALIAQAEKESTSAENAAEKDKKKVSFKTKLSNPRSMLPSKKIFLTLLLTTILMFTQSITYIGVLLYARVVRTSVYLLSFINAVTCLPGSLAATVIYRVVKVRRLPLQILTGVALVVMLIGGLHTVIAKPDSEMGLIICSNIGLLVLSATMIMMFVYVPELYPSSQRNLGLGVSAGLGRLGPLFSTFVNELDKSVAHGVPILFYCGTLLAQLIVLFILPETTGENLKDTEDDDKGKTGDSTQSKSNPEKA